MSTKVGNCIFCGNYVPMKNGTFWAHKHMNALCKGSGCNEAGEPSKKSADAKGRMKMNDTLCLWCGKRITLTRKIKLSSHKSNGTKCQGSGKDPELAFKEKRK